MEVSLNLGDLRALVDRLKEASDDVAVDVIVTVPGLQVPCPTSNWAKSEHRAVEVHGSGVSVKVKQQDGYAYGFGPPAGIVIFATAR